jgi:prepilin-type N-terminal cleavage/methylation domain-containing protein
MKVFSSDKGFTIIETMVAIGILAVGTLGVGTMLMISFSSVDLPRRGERNQWAAKIKSLRLRIRRLPPPAEQTFA